jgi:biopolymer transport protein ExbB/TolQ
MKKMKEKFLFQIKKVLKLSKEHIIILLASILLLVSLLFNYIQYRKLSVSEAYKAQRFADKKQEEIYDYFSIKAPFGVKKEIVKTCVNGVCKTQENESQLSDEDIKRIKDEIRKQQEQIRKEFERMQDYFYKQEELFKTFWR